MCIAGCPVPIYQDEGELMKLREIVQDLHAKKILEIGSLFGGTLWYWMQDAPGATIISIDIGVASFDYRFEDIEAAKRFWPIWARTNGINLIELQSNSMVPDTVHHTEQHAPFDFIFADGGHDYCTVAADYRNYWPMLRPGGVMAFHDIAYPDINPVNYSVGKLWREIKAKNSQWQEIIRPDNPEGIWGIGVVWK